MNISPVGLSWIGTMEWNASVTDPGMERRDKSVDTARMTINIINVNVLHNELMLIAIETDRSRTIDRALFYFMAQDQ